MLDLAVVPVVRLVKRDVPEDDSAKPGEGELVGPIEDGAERRPVLVDELVLGRAFDEASVVVLAEQVVRPRVAEQQVLEGRVAVREERL